ncbi:hypothetical protein BN1044_01891 [Hafnia alvei]|uniref:Uncharacterized protein n=1 Tax=Hafnia alvei TaxID=569 RepID=A0A1C6YZQ2_HAFAL|nr:hypothetical protein BN1044_01891 [Hafnia alvei]
MRCMLAGDDSHRYTMAIRYTMGICNAIGIILI